jgi:hypothetical protein
VSIGPTQEEGQGLTNQPQANWFYQQPVFPEQMSAEVFLGSVERELKKHHIVVFLACYRNEELRHFLIFFTQETGTAIAYQILDDREPFPCQCKTTEWTDNLPYAQFKIVENITEADTLPEEIKNGLIMQGGIEQTISACMQNFEPDTIVLMFTFLQKKFSFIFKMEQKALEGIAVRATERTAEIDTEITTLQTEQVRLRKVSQLFFILKDIRLGTNTT